MINSLVDNGFNGKQDLYAGQINRAIEAARSLRLDDGPVVAERDWGDDKGYSDFTTLAFRIFGFQIEALFSMYFAMLGAAFVFFTIRFYEDCVALFFLVAFFAAHLLVVQILPNSGVTSVVHDSRFLPTISCVSMFHWLLAIVRKNHRPRVEVPLLIAQAAVIVFVLNGRSSSIWQVWAIGFFLACAALWAYLRDETAISTGKHRCLGYW
ncbi:MAG: hypothetical protein IPK29_13990 [Betaproteobacteria bacterium]|nr:hypothetical protein [Betaproteobacteria bacterium]